MNIFNLSFGKDSMATLLLAIEQGIPIDRVMYCDIRFSDEISGEHRGICKVKNFLLCRLGILLWRFWGDGRIQHSGKA